VSVVFFRVFTASFVRFSPEVEQSTPPIYVFRDIFSTYCSDGGVEPTPHRHRVSLLHISDNSPQVNIHIFLLFTENKQN
jgi:hypothetical protein